MYTVSPQKYRELAPYIIIPQAKAQISYSRSSEKVSPEPPSENEKVGSKDSGSYYESKSKVFIDLNEADSAALISVSGAVSSAFAELSSPEAEEPA